MKFQELPESERAALKERARNETLIELWKEIPASSSQGWNDRAALAAEMLGDVRSVTDIGCGAMALERYLPHATYVPVDCVQRDARTIVVDLNREPAPETGTDAATLLGVLEYIHDVPKLLADLARAYRVILVTYNQAEDRQSAEGVTRDTWVNSFTRDQLGDVFEQSGLHIVRRESLGTQTLWLLRSQTAAL
ncbi:methyltransferase family protein [Methylovirgula ligni]|uniref:Methyltransferase family protein n=2 Tax=Methylovirgula ligni TaxID=569860 RepID=A0A3D9Z381_9HYPH|nr:methyltransferase family protein [Methylovirgula ligni]